MEPSSRFARGQYVHTTCTAIPRRNQLHSGSPLALPPQLAEVPWRDGGWTRKQIIGHLLDSATNNRHRFVRSSAEAATAGPQYGQDAWVAAHGYAGQSWDTLLHWWTVEHEILAAVVDQVPEDRLQAIYTVGDDAPVTLRFLIEDYLRHQHWHLAQLKPSYSVFDSSAYRNHDAEWRFPQEKATLYKLQMPTCESKTL